jgi:hypothetical protein
MRSVKTAGFQSQQPVHKSQQGDEEFRLLVDNMFE